MIGGQLGRAKVLLPSITAPGIASTGGGSFSLKFPSAWEFGAECGILLTLWKLFDVIGLIVYAVLWQFE